MAFPDVKDVKCTKLYKDLKNEMFDMISPAGLPPTEGFAWSVCFPSVSMSATLMQKCLLSPDV